MKDYSGLFLIKEDKSDVLSLGILVGFIDAWLEFMSVDDLIELVKERGMQRGKKNENTSNSL